MMRPGPKETQNHDNNNQKVYPQPMEETNRNDESMESLIMKVFNNISSLKAAYIQLQNAHTPYDPEKIQAADKLVIDELMKLSELKHTYRESHPKPAHSAPQDTQLAAEIQEQQNLLKTYEVMVKKFQSQIQTRDTEITQLQKQVEDSSQRKLKLEKKLKQRGILSAEPDDCGEENGFFSVDLNPSLFSSVAESAYRSVHDFSKPLINMMKASGWDLDAAADSIEPEVSYAKRSHKKFAFESYISFRMFSGFQEESFCIESDGSAGVSSESFFNQFLAIRAMDPLEVLSQNPDSLFGKFCRSKYLLVVHPKMESSFFGNLEHRNFVAGGGHPRTPFYQAFLKLAKPIWMLHRLAFSFDPKARVFQVKKGTEYSEVYMESMVKDLATEAGSQRPRVELMVMPGFVVGGSVVHAQVYLSRVRTST